MSLYILNQVLKGSNDQHKEQGKQDGRLPMRDTDWLYHLQNHDYEEVDVCHLSELLKEILR